MRAAWGARLADRVNELCSATSPGMLVREGLGGTGAEPIPKSRRLPRAASVKPWTFVCSKSEGEDGQEKREGGWYGAQLQIGLNANVRGTVPSNGKDDTGPTAGKITGLGQTDDGVYYCEVDLQEETAVLKIAEGASVPLSDFENNKVNVFIGKVEDGKQVEGIYCIPVIYKRLD